MRILLTNDDGIHAPGIRAMHDALVGIGERKGDPMGEVWTVAPLTVQSATGHGVTITSPLMTEYVRIHDRMEGIAVDGRPADCMKLGLASLWQDRFGVGERPDLVVSGINAGANCGINVIYSGTVAAALEAAFLGVPSIAVSLHLGAEEPDYHRAGTIARNAIEQILEAAGGTLEPHTCMNVNIPQTLRAESSDCAHEAEMLPIKVCPMNTHGLNDSYELRRTPAGASYYWATGHGLDFRGADPGTDVDWLFKRCVTVTPLHYDLTAPSKLAPWRATLETDTPSESA